MKKERKKREQKGYVRTKPHNKLTDIEVKEIQMMVTSGVVKLRIAKAMGITRMQLYRIIKQYDMDKKGQENATES
jgi:DNA invertase Pin-like site-specific DNA recombinase